MWFCLLHFQNHTMMSESCSKYLDKSDLWKNEALQISLHYLERAKLHEILPWWWGSTNMQCQAQKRKNVGRPTKAPWAWHATHVPHVPCKWSPQKQCSKMLVLWYECLQVKGTTKTKKVQVPMLWRWGVLKPPFQLDLSEKLIFPHWS